LSADTAPSNPNAEIRLKIHSIQTLEVGFVQNQPKDAKSRQITCLNDLRLCSRASLFRFAALDREDSHPVLPRFRL
jgi:hypothetical protein